jgi:hypothetical protein
LGQHKYYIQWRLQKWKHSPPNLMASGAQADPRQLIRETTTHRRLYSIHQGGLFQWVERHSNTINLRRLHYSTQRMEHTEQLWHPDYMELLDFDHKMPTVQKSKPRSYHMQLEPTL